MLYNSYVKICKVENCDKKHVARGYCVKHYERAKKTERNSWVPVEYTPKCTVPECSNPHVANGLCGMHYQRQRKHGDVYAVKSKTDSHPDTCQVANCQNPFLARGMCGMHYARWQAHGDHSVTLPPYNKLPGELAARNHVLSRYKIDARRRKFTWSLTDDQFDLLIKASCNYCGCNPDRLVVRSDRPVGPLWVTGIDRVDNDKGYTWDNVVPCCQLCNRAKHAMTITDFLTWIKRIAAYQGKQ